jgi:hypothetical protein
MEERCKHDKPLDSDLETVRSHKDSADAKVETSQLEILGAEADRLLDLLGEGGLAPIAPFQSTLAVPSRQGVQLAIPSRWYNQQNRQLRRCFCSPRGG